MFPFCFSKEPPYIALVDPREERRWDSLDPFLVGRLASIPLALALFEASRRAHHDHYNAVAAEARGDPRNNVGSVNRYSGYPDSRPVHHLGAVVWMPCDTVQTRGRPCKVTRARCRAPVLAPGLVRVCHRLQNGGDHRRPGASRGDCGSQPGLSPPQKTTLADVEWHTQWVRPCIRTVKTAIGQTEPASNDLCHSCMYPVVSIHPSLGEASIWPDGIHKQ